MDGPPMTSDQIRTARAGPELDRLAAETVMKWGSGIRHGDHLTAYGDRVVGSSRVTQLGERIDFAPSRDIAHAWELVEQMAEPTDAGARFGAWVAVQTLGDLTASEAALAITRAAILCATGERP